MYRVTSDELIALRESLTETVNEFGELRTTIDFATFCLFGAEWFRRNYEDSSWSWETIYQGLDWQVQHIERLKPNITKVVAAGLKWWGIEIVRLELSRRFLATLICQGGLPIHSLRRDGGRLTRFMKACLRERERFPGSPIGQIVDDQAYILPLSFRNPDFQFLAGRLIEIISKLRSLSDNHSESGMSRKEFLDRNKSDWALSLPLRVEESESLSLIISLLDEAKAKVFQDAPFSIATRLEQPESVARLVRVLEFPPTISNDELRRQFNVSPSNELHPRLLVFLNCGGKQTSCLSVTLGRDGTTFHIARTDRSSTTIFNSTDSIRLILKFAGEEIGQCSPVGGDELSDSPWVFNDRDPNTLVGIGGVRSREPSLLVAYPQACALEMTDGEFQILENLVRDRKIARISGTCTLRLDEGIYRIRSKCSKSQASVYELWGKQLRLGDAHDFVWLGIPTINEVTVGEHSIRNSIPQNRIQWRSARNPIWRPLSDKCLGLVWLRVIDDGEVKFQNRITILPSDFSVSIKPDLNSKDSGTIEMRNLGSATLEFQPVDGKIPSVDSAGRLHRVRVTVSGAQPGLLRCRIRFSQETDCEVFLVCPTRSMRLVDAANRTLLNNPLIPVDQLGGVTLRVVLPDHKEVSIYELENWQFLETTHLTKLGSVSELNLASISNYAAGVLAQSDEPDSKVSFGIVIGNEFKSVFQWSVSRYSKYLEKSDLSIANSNLADSTFFSLPADLVERFREDRDEVLLSVLPMHSISTPMPESTVCNTGDGVFRIDHKNYSPGFYLVVGHTKNSGEAVRPIRLAVKVSEIPQNNLAGLSREERFCSVLNLRSKTERKSKWREFCSELASDFDHPGWKNVDEILDTNKSLAMPITTFEVLAALTCNHDAIVRTAFARVQDNWFWDSMEQLPFLWSLVPVSSWIRGAQKSIEFVRLKLSSNGIDEAEIRGLIESQKTQFAEVAPARIRGLASILPALHEARIDIPIHLLGRFFDRNPIDTRNVEMARLIKQHDRYDTRRSWPNLRLNLPEFMAEKLRRISNLSVQGRFKNEWAMLNAPAIAALHCMYDLEASEELVGQIKRLKGIDPDWFNVANATAMQQIIEHRLNEDSKCFSKFAAEVI